MDFLKKNGMTIVVLLLVVGVGYFIYKEIKKNAEKAPGNTGIAGGLDLPQEVVDAMTDGAVIQM